MEDNAKEYIEKAEKYFSMRYHCSQAVLVAFSNELGISKEQALKLVILKWSMVFHCVYSAYS